MTYYPDESAPVLAMVSIVGVFIAASLIFVWLYFRPEHPLANIKPYQVTKCSELPIESECKEWNDGQKSYIKFKMKNGETFVRQEDADKVVYESFGGNGLGFHSGGLTLGKRMGCVVTIDRSKLPPGVFISSKDSNGSGVCVR